MKIAMMALTLTLSFSALATQDGQMAKETQAKEMKKEKKESSWAKKLRMSLAKNQSPIARL